MARKDRRSHLQGMKPAIIRARENARMTRDNLTNSSLINVTLFMDLFDHSQDRTKPEVLLSRDGIRYNRVYNDQIRAGHATAQRVHKLTVGHKVASYLLT